MIEAEERMVHAAWFTELPIFSHVCMATVRHATTSPVKELFVLCR